MKKSIVFIFLILTLYGVAYSDESETKVKAELKVGMTRSAVKAKLGIPLQMRGKIWKYKDFFVIFESGLLKCVIRGKCYGKWLDCHSFKKRSPECIILN